MEIQKEREVLISEIEIFIAECLKTHVVKCWAESYTNTDPFSYVFTNAGNNEIWWMKTQAHQLWEMWKKAKAQAVTEGFVLVPKENISCFWQDNDEPENFCNSSNDWDCLGDGIEKDQIMIVNKHTQAHISTEEFFGVWKLIETSYGTRWKFELFKSEFEAKQAMLEAQEPAND